MALDKIHTLAIRQFDVAEQDVDGLFFQYFAALPKVFSFHDGVTLQADDPGEQCAELLFVVDDEHDSGRHEKEIRVQN